VCHILSYNVANLNSKFNFSNFFSYIKSFDIFFLFETHVLPEKQQTYNCYFKEYILFWEGATKVCRAGRAKGGCLYGFKKSIQKKFCLKFTKLSEKNVLSIKIKNDICYLVPFYLNCTNWSADFENFETLMPLLSDKMFCIVGDLRPSSHSKKIFF